MIQVKVDMRKKKLVSYCLFAYNQEKFIKESIDGALNQTYSPLEIIISDDCSTDNTFEIIENTVKSYIGPHKIIVNKNKKNLGLGPHFSMVCSSISTGDYLVVTAGDDISLVNHVEVAVSYIEKNNNVNMVDFNADTIDETGKIIDSNYIDFESKYFSINDYINLAPIYSFAPGRIINRDLINYFNPISDNCPTEDSVLIVRSMLTGGFVRVNKTLLLYRRHSSNLSNPENLSKMSNSAIVSQYLSDVIFIYNAGIINDMLFNDLLHRLVLEIKLRNLRYSQYKNNFQKKCRILFSKILTANYSLNKYIKRMFASTGC